jgi:dUTP pyrophosphatase
MLRVKINLIDENTKLPVKGSLHAACYDVYAHSITHNSGKVKVGLGFKTEIPEGYKGIIVPRSNLTKYNWVMNNSFGVIDADYRGEWMVIFTSISPNTGFPYTVGDRVAQIYFEKVEDVTFIEEELSQTDRGSGGFGSTGVK